LGAAFLCAEFGFDGDVRNAAISRPGLSFEDDKKGILSRVQQCFQGCDYLRGLALAEPAK